MSLRMLKLLGDFPMLGELLAESFHYAEDEKWNAQQDEVGELSDMLKNLRRMWPLVSRLQLVSLPLRDIPQGYGREVADQPTGVALFQRRDTTDKWLVSTLGVLPAFRRCGTARKLMAAALEKMREAGAPIIFLEVIDGNLHAHQLYQDPGSEHYSGSVELTIEPGFGNVGPEVGNPCPLFTDIIDRQPRYELETAIAPERVLRMLILESDVTPELALASIRSIKVLGVFKADKLFRKSLADRII